MTRFSREEFTEAVRSSRTASETLRKLGLRAAGGNFETLRKYAALWGVSTEHFDPAAVVREHLRNRGPTRPLEEVMVRGSTYGRYHLEARLFAEGVKARRCELCGQGEIWRGARMALILDHINGVHDDNRLENLRIVCPNCAATFPTHCARKNRVEVLPRPCARCGESFIPVRRTQRYCSRDCARRYPRARGPRPEQRRVERPPYEQLVAEVRALGWSAVGRRYGVSDNAIRAEQPEGGTVASDSGSSAREGLPGAARAATLPPSCASRSPPWRPSPSPR